ncbi:diaminopimelate epimerase [Flavobacteriaceae bacterium AU392]|nr:diaminopimelate epimerase [Flavobacteriaceae bacterium]RKM86127.1 diaminopimelate epimerase [Flavobacteriaceae bacterium AU392]
MTHTFYKYQGTGNDFVIIDNRQNNFNKKDTKLVHFLCDRRFGIGGDGLILLENHSELDFKMVYYNADGNQSSMCGNGGRCITSFANYLGVINDKASFEAIDGVHHAIVDGDIVKLQMQDVTNIENYNSHLFLDTGSPHHVQFENNLPDLDVKTKGSEIRYGSPYNNAGANVNFVEKLNDNTFSVRTYERGVEDETLSCGTGVTAVALAMHHNKETDNDLINLKTKGGTLQVSFNKENNIYHDIWLIGPATQVFKGEIEW